MEKMLKEILNKLNTIEEDIKYIKVQQNEHGQLLSSLEHKANEHKALLDQLNHRTANIEGKLKTLEKDLLTVEYITGKNMSDIAQLKAIK